ncbi:hypothetical protein QGN32_17125 [Mycolicibacterium sp. ND9-15]|uniref:hypothetical protein n=1 Tax=Mycolicibacterium sp. ND9-15 TaxID=3042320 RepID=UPI002DDC01A0|nr:hypothetical protein [Mycolicibacterium sp. ND9-15]WSE55158.1 hypothetical protein QGN32_17125 [Mycolicibacterium sp. ND9-15]
MAPTDRVDLTTTEFDTVAWRFLRSEFASHTYSDWSLDRRLDAYLMHNGPSELLIDGSAYSALLERVMVNIGPARRNGVISSPKL